MPTKRHIPAAWLLCLLLTLIGWALRPAHVYAQGTPDPAAPYLSEVAPVSGQDTPAWVEITVGRVDPSSVDTPALPGAPAHIYLPAVRNNPANLAAATVARTAGATPAVAVAGFALDDLDGNRFTVPATLPEVPTGTVIVVLFDGHGPAEDDLDPSDHLITLHTAAGVVAPFEAAGDQVALFNAANQIVDFVAWGQAAAEDDDAAVAAGLWADETFVTYDEGFGAGGVPSPTTPNQSFGIWQDAPDQDAKNWVGYSSANSTPGKVNPPPTPLNSTVPNGAVIGFESPSISAAVAGPLANPGVALAWSGMGDKFQYQFELDNDADFGSPLVHETRSGASWSGVLAEGDYYWRTRIIDGRGKVGAYFGPFKITLVDLAKFKLLGTFKALLNPNEYKIQHKDSPLLDIGGGTNNVVMANNAGDRRYPKDKNWDGEHVDANNVPRFGWNGIDNWYCVRASTAMLNDYYGGTLTQDRISYYAFEQLNQNWYGSPANLRGKPEHDLGFGVGIGSYSIQENVLSWALGGVAVTPILYCPPNPNDGNDYTCPSPGGAPMSFADVKSLIDAGRPFMSINLRNAHARVVDGYWDIAPGQQWVHLIDPVPADTSNCPTCTNAQWLTYATFAANHERTIVGPASVPNPRQDEGSIKQDTDSDGISNFDESNRFATDPNNPDTDGDWVTDKNDMAEYIFDVSNVGVYVYTPGTKPKTSDYDGDGKRKELDWDNDADGVPDGCEDVNVDGEFDGAGETSNFNINSKQVCQPRFAIVNPVTGQAANAGDPANPDRVLIRLRMALPPALPNKPAFAASQFGATIGGLAAPVVTGAQVGQEFWLLVQAPAEATNSFFDLAVTFDGAATGHNNQADTEANAIYYIPRPRLDSLVVLDTSGSMAAAGKLDSAKNAARLYVDQFAENDQIGVVTFDDNATVDLALTAVQANGQALTDAKNAIDATVPNGQTAMGAGLLAGQQQLAAAGGADHDWSLMLLTDGQENVAPFWNDAAVSGAIIPSKTVVQTIGLGDPTATWFGLLQQIAGATGGVFGAVNDPSVVMAASGEGLDNIDAVFPNSTANLLADAYKYAAEQVLGEQRLFEATGVVSAAGCAVHRFMVGNVPSVVFTANFASPNQARLDVFRPDNSQVNPADVGVIHRLDATHEQYRVAAPPAGLWHVDICRLANPLASGTEYVFFAAADSPLTLSLVAGTPVVKSASTGVPVAELPVLAFLADTQPVLGAAVTVDVRLPNGQSGTPASLLDDGQHGDGLAGDGVYGATLGIVQRGTYLLKAKAVIPGAGASYRYAQTTVQY